MTGPGFDSSSVLPDGRVLEYWEGGGPDGRAMIYAKWYADRISGAEPAIFPGEGHLDVCDTHWPGVLAGLLRAWN